MAIQKFYSASHLGKKREIQEDSNFAGAISDDKSLIEYVLIIADGMGGLEAGEVASNFIRDNLIDLFVNGGYRKFGKINSILLKNDKIEYLRKILSSTISFLHDQLRKKAGSKSMGTTCTIALILRSKEKVKHVLVGHVGDSRAYKITNKEIKQITKDDSLVWDYYSSGKLTKEQIRKHKQKNVITQALGGDSYNAAHIYHTKISDDEILLLSSDGMHGLLSDDEIHNICRSSSSLPSISKKLIDAANDRGGNDNISVSVYGNPIDGLPNLFKARKPWLKIIPLLFVLLIVSFGVSVIFFNNNNDENGFLESKLPDIERPNIQSSLLTGNSLSILKNPKNQKHYSNQRNFLKLTLKVPAQNIIDEYNFGYEINNVRKGDVIKNLKSNKGYKISNVENNIADLSYPIPFTKKGDYTIRFFLQFQDSDSLRFLEKDFNIKLREKKVFKNSVSKRNNSEIRNEHMVVDNDSSNKEIDLNPGEDVLNDENVLSNEDIIIEKPEISFGLMPLKNENQFHVQGSFTNSEFSMHKIDKIVEIWPKPDRKKEIPLENSTQINLFYNPEKDIPDSIKILLRKVDGRSDSIFYKIKK